MEEWIATDPLFYKDDLESDERCQTKGGIN